MELIEEFKEEVAAAVAKERVKLLHALKEQTPIDTGEARDSWRIVGDSIINTAAHISKLNRGSSKQAPSHFIEKTLLSHPGVTPSGTIVRSI